MKRAKMGPRHATTRLKSFPRKMSTKELCTRLVSIAAFHVEDGGAQKKIYEAVRRLQVMEAAAIDAGLLPK